MLLIPLTSPVTSAVASDGGPERPPACRITHGPHDSYFEKLAGKPVASIRRCPATVFSIPDNAEAFVGGSVVGPAYRLRAGDRLEFLVRRGRKGGVAKNTAESKRTAKLIRAKKKACYLNAFRVIQEVPGYQAATYVEGIVVQVMKGGGFPFEHGWVEKDGEVIDPTLPAHELVYFPGLRFVGVLGLAECWLSRSPTTRPRTSPSSTASAGAGRTTRRSPRPGRKRTGWRSGSQTRRAGRREEPPPIWLDSWGHEVHPNNGLPTLTWVAVAPYSGRRWAARSAPTANRKGFFLSPLRKPFP